MPASMTVNDYTRLRASLDAPRERVIADVPEFLHPHTPPDDADFPTPTNGRDVVDLLEGVELRQRVLCGVTAFELAVPAWLWLLETLPAAPDFPGPDAIAREATRWLAGDAIDDAVRTLQDGVQLLAEPPADFGRHPDEEDPADDADDPTGRRIYDLFMVSMYGVLALAQAIPEDRGFVTIGFGGAELAAVEPLQLAIAHAARAASSDGHPPTFLTRWWRHCRCRLAWSGAADDGFELPGVE